MQDLEFRQAIERVKLRSPIEVAVGERVPALRRQGKSYWACCPFHQEKTPSFCVDPQRGTWRCFGACADGGDVLSFVERFDGLTFIEALRLLARQCGEELPERTLRGRAKGAEAELEARHDLLRWAADFYRAAWRGPEGAAARAYMRRRGLGDEVLDAFGIGWSSEGGHALVDAAARDKKPLEWLIELGLARRNDAGRAYDFFRGRVLIPIRDRLGRTVGFGGRVLTADGEAAQGPKYVNTPETSLFHKGRLIFGLDLAASSIRGAHELFLVEGYTDVMAAHQAGWKQAVAVLGTATTDDHAALIRRTGARRIVLVFDGDEAGRKASHKALSGLLGLPVELRVAALPEGRDPGDLLVEAGGRDVFRASIEGAREWFDWCLAGLAGLRGAELASAVEERLPLIAKLARPVERSARLVEMARFLGLPEADVRAQWDAFERARRNAARPAAPEVAAPRPKPAAGAEPERLEARAYGLLLGALLLDNSLVPVHGHLAAGAPEGDLALLFRTLLELYERDESGAAIDASAVMTALGDHPARNLAAILQTQASTAESAEILARDQVRWLEQRRNEREIEPLKAALETGGVEAELAALARLHTQLRNGRVPTQKSASVPFP